MYLSISIYKIFRQITVEIFLKLVYNQLYIDCGRYFKMKAYTPQIMQIAENYMFSKGIKPIDLMKKAASGMFSLINDRIDLFDAIVILCGKGNNAGDGYELARILKTKGYNVYETHTHHIIWKWMTKEERLEARKNNMAKLMVNRDDNGKIIRKIYSDDTRKLIYNNANGKCELCGRKILLEDMTLDHIKPLSMGGEDELNNLACTCYPCNLF